MANNSYEPHDNQETPAAEGIFGFKNSVEVSAENEKSESKVFEEEMDRPHTVRAGATPAKVELPFNLEYDGGRNLNAEAQNKDSDGDRVNQDEKLQRSGSLRHLLGMGSAAKNQAPKEVRDVMVKRFYCLRPGNFEHAVDDVKQYMDTKTDGTFLSAWLLTEIDHWDHEKERIVIITDKQLLIIKYNFIALRIDDYKRVALQRIQKIQSGRFVYPKNSMMMKIEVENEDLQKSLSKQQEQMKVIQLQGTAKDKDTAERMQETNNKISQLTVERNQTMDELRQAQQRIHNLEDKKQSADLEVTKLTESLAEERKKTLHSRQEGQKQLQDLYDRLSRVQEEKVRGETKHRQEKQELEKEINELKIGESNQEGTVFELTLEREMLTKDKEYLEEKVRRLETELVKAKTERRIVHENITTQKQVLVEESTQMQEKLQSLESGKNDLQLALEKANKELEKKEKLVSVKRTVYKDNDKEIRALKNEIERERKEKLEALSCLKALILDNEAMAKCIHGLQETVALQRQENYDSRRHLNEILEKYEYQREISFRTQSTLEGVMQSRINRESQETAKLQEDMKMLRRDFDSLRQDKDKMVGELEAKNKEMNSTKHEMGELRNLVERKIGDLDVEKRAKEMLEGKLQYLAQDRNVAMKKLQSVEVSNKTLQSRLLGLQKWHNNLEGNMIRSREHSTFSLENLQENQKKYDEFLRDQLKELTTKLNHGR